MACWCGCVERLCVLLRLLVWGCGEFVSFVEVRGRR